jgi:hypothetical protein
MRSKKIRLVALGFVITAISLAVLLLPARSSAQFPKETTVKLYAGEKLVATWENAHAGRVDGNTYVFTIPPENREVRISGTYSVEAIR